MIITLEIPSHVSSWFEDEASLSEWLIAQATDFARAAAAASASDQAQQIIREATAPFDNNVVPEVKTVSERLTDLREGVRTVGVVLAMQAGVSQEDAIAAMDQALSNS